MVLNKISLHETMQLHELLNAKTIGMIKAKLIQGVVFDQELRALLEKDVQHSYHSISTLTNLLTKAQESLKEDSL
jgi:similar to spore coat protein